MTKTQFEEIFAEIRYTEKYNRDKIILWYLDKHNLRECFLSDILSTEHKMLRINREKYEDYDPIEIPFYRIYVITHGNTILMDRRDGYQGIGELTLPDDIESTFRLT